MNDRNPAWTPDESKRVDDIVNEVNAACDPRNATNATEDDCPNPAHNSALCTAECRAHQSVVPSQEATFDAKSWLEQQKRNAGVGFADYIQQCIAALDAKDARIFDLRVAKKAAIHDLFEELRKVQAEKAAFREAVVGLRDEIAAYRCELTDGSSFLYQRVCDWEVRLFALTEGGNA